MRKVPSISILLFFILPATLFAQRDSLRNLFLDAESWFQFEEYSEALPLFEMLIQSDPANDKLNYKIGICLLNDPYQKDMAVPYLLKASSNINPSCKVSSYKERTAPPDVLFYLGKAYQVNEELEKAIESYEEFLDIMDPEVYDLDLVQNEIQACRNAMHLKTMPVDFDLRLLDTTINTRYADVNPVLSGDGTKMAFITRLPFYDAAFFTQKAEKGWTYPQAITQILGFDSDVYPVALSYDGSEMILYYDDEYIGNLYYSKYEEGQWLRATKLDEHISTKFWESHASFSKDAQSLYFTSNRKGTFGGLDIYLSERQSDGKWGIPQNLGSTINSQYNEETPCISPDGQTLYFSSYGHYNMGGYDVFYSKKNKDGSWAEPVNMGYPINTTGDDLFFQAVNEGKNAYYSLYSPRGMGLHDIYYMTIYSDDHPRIYEVSGILRTEDGVIDAKKLTIAVVDNISGDTLRHSRPENRTGKFGFWLMHGSYMLHFQGEEYEDLERSLRIDVNSDKAGIRMGDNIVLQLMEQEAPLFVESEVDSVPMEDPLDVEVMDVTTMVPLHADPAPEIDAETEAQGDTIHPVEEPSQDDISDATESDIEESVIVDEESGKKGERKDWLLWLLFAGSASFLFCLILWWRRRKKERHQEG